MATFYFPSRKYALNYTQRRRRPAGLLKTVDTYMLVKVSISILKWLEN